MDLRWEQPANRAPRESKGNRVQANLQHSFEAYVPFVELALQGCSSRSPDAAAQQP